jgi:sulfofructose kinase
MEVIGIDTPCMDLLAHIRALPKANESTGMLEYSWQGGGKVATAIIALSRLGSSCGIIGYVGDDSYGEFCVKDFMDHGVDTTYLIKDAGKETPFSIVLSDEKECGRNIIYYPGNAKKLAPEDLDRDYIVQARYLHLSKATKASVLAAKWAKEKGMVVVFDADSYSEEMEQILPFIDVLIASEFYYRALFNNTYYETNCRTLLGKGHKIVVITLGDKGCVGIDESGYFEEQGFKVTVVDTTGAGDVYHGAFIYGLLQNWDAKRIARFANAVSAIKCTRIGGRAAIPDLKTVERFINTGEIDFSEIDKRVEFYRRRGI